VAVEQLVKETGSVGNFRIFLAAAARNVGYTSSEGKNLQELQTFVKQGKVRTF